MYDGLIEIEMHDGHRFLYTKVRVKAMPTFGIDSKWYCEAAGVMRRALSSAAIIPVGTVRFPSP